MFWINYKAQLAYFNSPPSCSFYLLAFIWWVFLNWTFYICYHRRYITFPRQYNHKETGRNISDQIPLYYTMQKQVIFPFFIYFLFFKFYHLPLSMNCCAKQRTAWKQKIICSYKKKQKDAWLHSFIILVNVFLRLSLLFFQDRSFLFKTLL